MQSDKNNIEKLSMVVIYMCIRKFHVFSIIKSISSTSEAEMPFCMTKYKLYNHLELQFANVKK